MDERRSGGDLKAPDESSSPLVVATDVSAVPDALAGAGQYTLSVVGALARRGDVALDLVTRRSDTERWRLVAPNAAIAGLAPDATPARVVYGEVALASALAHRFGDAEAFFGPHYTAPSRLKVPAVVTVHDLTLVDNPEWHEPMKSIYFRSVLRRAAKKAAVIVCVSERTAKRLRERFEPVGKVVVIPHGIDHERFDPAEPSEGFDAAALRRLGVTEPFVLHVGTLEPRKNLPALIGAFDSVAPTLPRLSLVLVGSHGWGSRAVAHAIEVARHRDRIIRLGYVGGDDVPAMLRRAAVVAYPSFAEGFGLPALEALACGAPLVTSFDTVMSDVAGTAAVLVDPFDHGSIAAGIVTAITDATASGARRREGLSIASGYTWERSAEGHVAAFAVAGR